jgi:hypothetical protein
MTNEPNMRLPNLEVLREIKGGSVHGCTRMHGVRTRNRVRTTSYNGAQGFAFELEGDHLVVRSYCDGYGITYHITPQGHTIRDGFETLCGRGT